MQLPAAHSLGENAAVDRVRGEPQLCKLNTFAELMPFPFREDFFIGAGEFPERRHIVFFDFRDILGGQNQILTAALSVSISRADSSCR